MCHSSGIRHYNEILTDKNKAKNNKRDPETEVKAYKDIFPVNKSPDHDLSEFFLNKNFKTTTDALEIFKNDPLLFEPGVLFMWLI